MFYIFFFFQAEDGIRGWSVTGVQTCALPISRCFDKLEAIGEDPVTGSAHCYLIPYWAEKLQKEQFVAHQISQRRGELHCQLLDDRVRIAGQAVTYLVGEIEV